MRLGVSIAAMAAIIVAGTTFSVAHAQNAQRAGVAAGVQGDVSLTGPVRPSEKAVKSGDELVLDDRLTTGAESHAQALLIDETTLTLGPDSELTIDKFVFDPDGDASEISANFVKGAMRFVSGRIGRLAPQRVNVRTPVGTLGIRGTIAFAVSQPDENGVFFGLLGPSRGNDLKGRNAGIEFQNDMGGQETYKAGYGFLVREGEAPGAVGPIPTEVLTIVENDLRIQPRAQSKQTGVTYSESASGSDVAAVFIDSGDFQEIEKRAELTDDPAEDITEEINKLNDIAGEVFELGNIIAFVGLFDFKVFDVGAAIDDEVQVLFFQDNNNQDFGVIDLVTEQQAAILGVQLQPGDFRIEILSATNDFETVGLRILSPIQQGQINFDDIFLDPGDKAILRGEAINDPNNSM